MSYPRRSSLLSIKMVFVLTFIQYFVIQGCFGISRWRLKRPLSENSENSAETKLKDLITKQNLWESRLRNNFQVVMGPGQDLGLGICICWARSARRDNPHFRKGIRPRRVPSNERMALQRLAIFRAPAILPDHAFRNSRDFCQEFWSGQVVGNLILIIFPLMPVRTDKIFFFAFLTELGHLKKKTIGVFLGAYYLKNTLKNF